MMVPVTHSEAGETRKSSAPSSWAGWQTRLRGKRSTMAWLIRSSMPVVISVIFFITFHVLSITGEKLAKEGSVPVYVGMWMATMILLPIGIFLTYKATADSTLFDVDAYFGWVKRLFSRFSKKSTGAQ